jgi:RNA polymerase sigma factor (TIGR02999 family)
MSASEVTRLLERWSGGERAALDELMPLVYKELRRLAQSYFRGEAPGHTLQATALVHEAFLRLTQENRSPIQNRAHFFAVAATAMRRILIDHARRARAEKRGGRLRPLSLDEARETTADGPVDVLALDILLRQLEELDPRQARIVEMRCFAGLGIGETALVLEVSEATVKRDWNMAKAWLRRELLRTR